MNWGNALLVLLSSGESSAFLRAAESCLRTWGFDVTWARDADTALHTLLSTPVTLMIAVPGSTPPLPLLRSIADRAPESLLALFIAESPALSSMEGREVATRLKERFLFEIIEADLESLVAIRALLDRMELQITLRGT